MKCCDKPPCVPCMIGAVGVLLAIAAVVGRFHSARTVLGSVLPDGGIAASSLLLCANTVLLIAIFAKLTACGKGTAKEEPTEEPKSE